MFKNTRRSINSIIATALFFALSVHAADFIPYSESPENIQQRLKKIDENRPEFPTFPAGGGTELTVLFCSSKTGMPLWFDSTLGECQEPVKWIAGEETKGKSSIAAMLAKGWQIQHITVAGADKNHKNFDDALASVVSTGLYAPAPLYPQYTVIFWRKKR